MCVLSSTVRPREPGQQGAEADALLGVEPGGRLVHDQQAGIGEQRLGDADPPPHAAGEAPEPAVGVPGQRDHLQQLADPPAPRGGGPCP